jgi:hypothetical protein
MRPAFWIAVITSLLPVGLSAQLADNSAPVIRDEVWRAVVNELRERGVSERELPPSENFDLPAAPPARAGRRLQVASACWDEGRQRLQFRLECAVAGECLPFLAYLHTSRIQSADPDHPMRADREEQACRVVAGPRVTAQSALKGAAKSALQPASQLTMRPGDPAIAVFTGNGMRMTASVTCLDRGREGETVRVRGPDGNVFRARISGPARLEVSLNNAR